MDIANTCSKHIYTEVCNCFAFIWICTLTHANNTIFFTADGTNLCFKGHPLLCTNLDKFLCLGNILINRIAGTIKHDG